MFPTHDLLFFDTRMHKEALTIILALLISLIGIYEGSLKPIKNKWLIALLVFLPFSFFNTPIIGAWQFKCLAYILIYLLLFMVISSREWDRKILTIIATVGLVMSLYVMVQKAGLDQFYSVRETRQEVLEVMKVKYPTSWSDQGTYKPVDKARFNRALSDEKEPALVGTLGNASLVAPFILLCFPLALRLRKWKYAAVMALAIVLTKSFVAIAALVIVLLLWGCHLFKKNKWILIGITILLCVTIGTGLYKVSTTKGLDNGRIVVWQQVWQDFNMKYNGQKYTMTGLGLGSYREYFVRIHKTKFLKVHNEYLEWMYCTGIIGLGLFLMTLLDILRRNRKKVYLCLSLIGISLCAMGTFVWQLAPHIFYTIIILGLLCSTKNIPETV